MDKNIIKKIYSEDSRRLINTTKFDITVGSEGYGETGFDSMETIVSHFNEHFNENTVFYDLGCGTGKIVYHIGLCYPVKKSCGIEFSKERCIIANQIREKYDIQSDKISILNKNILDCDISDATVIYMDNTLFPKVIVDKINDIIPVGCLVISRAKFSNQLYISNKINGSVLSNYGGSSLYYMIK